jgi:hypothetical protein
MSGYGTAKFQHNALNLGFPTAFARDYAANGEPEVFAPDRTGYGLNNTVGNDFQAQWHQQKKRDADYMANAKVRSTHTMNARAFSSPHGYYNLPPAVLGQRRFANAAMGAIYSHSTREDQPSDGAPFHLRQDNHSSFPSTPRAKVTEELTGGVLRTSAGQRHGKQLLDQRIAQLDAIDEAKQAFLTEGNSGRTNTVTPFAGAQGTMDSALTSAPLVELSNLLQGIKDALVSHGGRNVSHRDVLSDSTKAFALIIRMAVNNSASDMANVLEFIQGTSAGDGIGQLLEFQAEAIEAPEDDEEARFSGRVQQQIEWWGNIARYLKKMIEVSELPIPARQQTSNALIKTLGFNKLVRNSEATYRTGVVRDDDFIDSTGNVNNPLNAQRAEDLQARAGRSGAFINPGRRPLSGRIGREAYASQFVPFDNRSYGTWHDNVSSRGSYGGFDDAGFSQPSERREDSQRGYFGQGGAAFTLSAQEPFAYGSGEFLDRSGGRPRAWMGEEAVAEYGEAPEMAAIQEANEQAGVAGVGEGEDLGDGENRATPGDGLSLSSRRDPVTGEYNVVSAPSSASSSTFSSLFPSSTGSYRPPQGTAAPARMPQRASSSSASAEPPAGKLYTAEDVPRTIPELRQFIQMLAQRHGYSQAIYKKDGKDPKARSVRMNTLAKMKIAGLL